MTDGTPTCPDCGRAGRRMIRTVCSACYNRRWKLGLHAEVPPKPRPDLAARESKVCPGCEQDRPRVDFAKANARADGLMGICRMCAAERRRAAAEHYREYELRRRYGLSVASYEALAAKQGYACAICQAPCGQHASLSVDHDHTSGRVRGLLCAKCNKALGLLGDDPSRLVRAAEYLTVG